jgi:hypothetical protein
MTCSEPGAHPARRCARCCLAQVVKQDGYFHGRGVDDDKGGLLQPLHVSQSRLRARRNALYWLKRSKCRRQG